MVSKPPSANVRFKQWLSRIQHAGTRGFFDSEVRAVHGSSYQRQMGDWIALRYIEQRDPNRPTLWWISAGGRQALESIAEVQQALQEGDT
jgi:hypothetical protein